MTKVEMVWPGDEYCPVQHVTAGEMRAQGRLIIPARVPDCAWIPRDAYKFAMHITESQKNEDTVQFFLKFGSEEPFRWQRMTVEVDATPEEIRASLRSEEGQEQ